MTHLNKINDIRKTGELIYSIGGNASPSDYNYLQEQFYKTNDGKFYIICTGGAGSPCRKGNAVTAAGAVKLFLVHNEYVDKRIQADKDGFVEDRYERGHFFRYTESGDIETIDISKI